MTSGQTYRARSTRSGLYDVSDLTAKQEAFCRAYVETSNAAESYRRSYDVGADTKPETVWQAASRLMADDGIKSRIADLLDEARALCLVTVGSLTAELEDARKHAMKDDKGASAAVSAVMGKAKLHGLLVDKVAQTDPNGRELPAAASDRELAKAAAMLLAKGLKEAGGSAA
jgi:phage terminase small subunit